MAVSRSLTARGTLSSLAGSDRGYRGPQPPPRRGPARRPGLASEPELQRAGLGAVGRVRGAGGRGARASGSRGRAAARRRSADHRRTLFPRALGGRDGDRARTAPRHGQIAALASPRPAATATGVDAMSGELEQRLLALGSALDVPPAPDLVPAVLTGLPARRRRPHRPAGRVLAV